MDRDYGRLVIHLTELLEKAGLNRNQLTHKAEMNWNQVNSYCENTITRLDVYVLCKLCTVLECDINDLLEYIPPEANESDKLQ